MAKKSPSSSLTVISTKQSARRDLTPLTSNRSNPPQPVIARIGKRIASSLRVSYSNRSNPRQWVILGLIIILIFLRFYKTVDWFSFNFDEEYQAQLAWSQVKDFHPIWIGVSASNFGFYLGPAFTYLNALLFWISKGDLSILAYFASLFGVITTFSIYYVTKEVFSKKAAMIATIIYGFSALIITFDRRFWNPTPIAFVTIWLFFSLQKAIKDPRWFILTAILMAAGLHIHLSLMVYWPLVLYRVFRQAKKIPLKTWIHSVIAYLVVVSPLLVFDFNHNYDNLLGPFRYILSPKTSGSVFGLDQLSYHLHNVWLSLGRILYLDWGTTIQDEHGLGVHAIMTRPPFLISLISLTALLWFFLSVIASFRNAEPKQSPTTEVKRNFFFMLLSILTFYIIYPSIGCEYYLLGFFALMAIVMGLFLENFSWKILTPVLAVFVIYNSISVITLDQSKYGLQTRRELVNKVMSQIEDSPFRLETVGEDPRSYHPYGGWRYIFQTYGNAPDSSSADEFFGWIYPDEFTEEKPLYKVVISEEVSIPCHSGLDPESIQITPECNSFSSGAFTAYIFRLQ